MTHIYRPYTSTPSSSDKNFINTSYGGYAHCIKRNSKGYTLPNCVAFAHGMWLKTITDAVGLDMARSIEARMCRGNAEAYWAYDDGFERGQTPKLNAIMVWEGKGSLAGHVMTVTEIKDNGDVIGTGSDYSGAKFYTRTYYASKGYNFSGSYVFKGFIYCPYEFAYTVGEPVERDTERDQVEISISNLRARSAPALAGSVVMGYVNPGLYNVYATEEADGHLWYCIEENGTWCAQVNGVEFLEGHPEPHFNVLVRDIPEELADELVAVAKAGGATRIKIAPC